MRRRDRAVQDAIGIALVLSAICGAVFILLI